MKKQSLTLIAFSCVAMTLSACSNKAESGAVIGALVGAAVGKSTGNHHDRRAVPGAIIGMAVGSAIGEQQDRNSAKKIISTQTNKKITKSTAKKVKHTHRYRSAETTHIHTKGDKRHSHRHTSPYVYDHDDYGPEFFGRNIWLRHHSIFYNRGHFGFGYHFGH